MTAAVAAQYVAAWNSGGNSLGINVTTAPAAGAAVWVQILHDSNSATATATISGLGATWTLVHSTAWHKVWRGTGATTSGSVAVALSGAQGTMGAAWVVTGSDNTLAAVAAVDTTGSTLTGPAQVAGPGQVVLTMAEAFASITSWPASPVPATGWTSGSNGPYSAAAWRVPTVEEVHQLSLTASGTGNHTSIGQIVVGAAPAAAPVGTRVTQQSSGTTLAVPFPTTATGASRNPAVGDVMVVVVGSEYAPDTSAVPAGWTMLRGTGFQPNIGGYVLRKTLTAADVTAGSVTVTMYGSARSTAVAVNFPPDSIVDAEAYRATGNDAAKSEYVGLQPGQRGVYLAFNLSTTYTTISRGLVIATANAATGPSVRVTSEGAPVAGTTVTYTPPAGTSRYEVTLTVTDRATLGAGAFLDEMAFDQPWGWWRSSETSGTTLADAGPNSRPLTVTGAPTFGLTTQPAGEKAIGWPNAGGVYASSSASFDPGAGGWTHEAWVYLPALPEAQTSILSPSNSSGSAGSESYLSIGTDGKPMMGTWNNTWAHVTAPAALSLGAWHHVAGTVDLTGQMRLYVDGEVVATGQNVPYVGAPHPIRLHGGYSGTGGTVRVSNPAVHGRALTTARVKAHFLSGEGLYARTVLTDGPETYWRFTETAGTAIADVTGNGRAALVDGTGYTRGAAGLLTGDPDPALALNGSSTLATSALAGQAWMNAAAFTAEVLTTLSTLSGTAVLMAHDNDGVLADFRWRVYFDAADAKLKCVMANAANGYVTYNSGITLSVNTTYHVVLTYASGTMLLYVNGVAAAPYSVSLKTSGGAPIRVGGLRGGHLSGLYSLCLSGRVDDFAFYAKALPADRVAAHYAAVAGPAAPATPTVTGTVSGSGVVSGAVVPIATATGTVAGTGAVTGTGATASYDRTGTVLGDGTVSGTTVPVGITDGTVTGSGTISAVVSVVEAGEVIGTVTGTGTVSGTAFETYIKQGVISGSGVVSGTVTPVGNVLGTVSGSGTISATVEVVDPGGGGSGTPIDLSTTIDLYPPALIPWNGSYVTVPDGDNYADFTFPLFVDPATTYSVEVDYEVTAGAFGGYFTVSSLIGPTTAEANASNWETLHTEPGISVGTGTLTFDIGPGIESWDAAMSADEKYLIFSIGRYLRISAIRTAPALESGGSEEPPGVSGTDTANRTGGRTRNGYGVASWTPDVVPVPEGVVLPRNRVSAAAFGPVTMNGSQAVYDVSLAEISAARQQIIIGGKDITFWRGVPTPDVDYGLVEPFLYGPGTLYLPQVASAFEEPGEGDLTWLEEGKTVVVNLVLNGVIIKHDVYRGIVLAFEPGDPGLNVEFGGELQGRASLRDKQPPRFRDVLDLGRLAWRAVKDLGLPFQPRMGPDTGINALTWGGSTHLDYMLELCAMAQTVDGGQWTIMPDENRMYRMALKDRTTVHYTIFTDDTRTVASMRRDAAEKRTRVFATGVTPKGQRVMFGAYPGLKQSTVPDYPMAGGTPFGVGTTNDDTMSGDGISVMVNRLWVTGFLSLADYPGGYDDDLADAVEALQNRAGITGPVGVMTPALWDVLWDVHTSYTLRGAEILPASQDPRVDPYVRSASGAIIGKNPDHDRKVLVVDTTIDVGTGFRRGQIRRFSRSERLKSAGRYGTVSINMGAVLAGDVAIGTEVTPEMVRDARIIRPGENVRLPMKGGILAHVTSVDVTTGNVVLTVDTEARDALKVWEVIERNRETKRSAARLFRGNRASTETKDSIEPWDEVGGTIDGDISLAAGWTVIPVVAGQEGTMGELSLKVHAIATGDGREYACAVFGREITAARLNSLMPNPLSEAGTDKWEKRTTRKALRKYALLYGAGTNEDPCGYSPGRKSKGAPLTGLHEDPAGFGYKADPRPVVYLAVFTASEGAALLGGRGDHVMNNRLEAGA